MSSPATDFPLFSRLLIELRKEIWRCCLPYRVCEVNQPVDDAVFDWPEDSPDGPFPCELRHTTYMNGSPPLITRVCHESRSVVFETGHVLAKWAIHRPEEVGWGTGLDNRDIWQDHVRDSAHLNWDPVCEGEYPEVYNPLSCVSWDASQMSGGGSLMIRYLDERFGTALAESFVNNDSSSTGPPIITPLSDQKLSDLETLIKLPKWLVEMRVVVIHSSLEAAAATNFFGVDTRVLVVDADDEDEVEALFALAKSCERGRNVTVRQNLHREAASSMKQTIKGVVTRQFQSKDLASRMQPATMFRLCTRMCNHSYHDHLTDRWKNSLSFERFNERQRFSERMRL